VLLATQDPKAAIEPFDRAETLTSCDRARARIRLLLATALARSGRARPGREVLGLATTWMNQNAPGDEELGKLRAEAEAALR
jgi:hypothetical protein